MGNVAVGLMFVVGVAVAEITFVAAGVMLDSAGTSVELIFAAGVFVAEITFVAAGVALGGISGSDKGGKVGLGRAVVAVGEIGALVGPADGC